MFQAKGNVRSWEEPGAAWDCSLVKGAPAEVGGVLGPNVRGSARQQWGFEGLPERYWDP